MKMLLADDEPDILELLQYNLKKEGYEIHTANNGVEAVEIAKKELPEIIILDIMMPLMNGVVTCKTLRSLPELKDKIIILLSARGEEYSEVAGLENGADDYIKKPIKIAVLKARIKALINRISRSSETDELTLGDLRVSLAERVVYKNNEALHLPKKEFMLLSLLLSKPNKLFTEEEIEIDSTDVEELQEIQIDFSDEEEEEEEEEEEYVPPIVERGEIRAEFPGGNRAFMKWAYNNLKIPEADKQKGVRGMVMVQFVIYEDGFVRDIEIVRGISTGLDNAVIALLKTSPRWTPGKTQGQKVRERWRYPIKITPK